MLAKVGQVLPLASLFLLVITIDLLWLKSKKYTAQQAHCKHIGVDKTHQIVQSTNISLQPGKDITSDEPDQPPQLQGGCDNSDTMTTDDLDDGVCEPLKLSVLRNSHIDEEANNTKEDSDMDSSLSREELDVLLGSRKTPLFTASQLPNLSDAVQAAGKALRSFVASSTAEWSAQDPVFTNWQNIPTVLGLPTKTSLLLTEARVPGGCVYVAATTLAACRLDEAAVARGSEDGPPAFTGWRRAIEYLLTDLCLTLLPPDSSLELYPRTLPPKRWAPESGATTLSSQLTNQVAVAQFGCIDEPGCVMFLLIPTSTLTVMMGANDSDLVAATAICDVPSETSVSETSVSKTKLVVNPLNLIADVPLDVSISYTQGRFPVRSVAGWEPGSLVPVSFQAGQEMELLVNGKRLASGRLVEGPSGALSVEILAVFPATAEVG